MEAIANYILGERIPPVAGRYLDNVEPATGRVYSQVPDSDADDVDLAVEAAALALPEWSATPAEQRSRMLLRIADLIERSLEALARAECIDTGKPLARCRTVDIPRAVANFRFFATAILHERSDAHVMDRQALNYTLRRPRGVAGVISPWNLPLYLLTWKIAPALATGNTVVAKPSELTPMTAHLLAELCREARLPPGVLNIVHGTGPKAGAALVRHPKVSALSFTGSTRTGAEIARSAAPLFKKLSLEMGGKNPNIVFADACGPADAALSYDQVLDTSLQAAFANQGQICLCGSRLLVEQSIAQDFVERFVARARELRIGDPLEEGTEQGALVSRAQLEKTEYYVDLAREEGGRILCGGQRPTDLPPRCREGYFYAPTVIVGLGPQCRANQEEIFGPVVSIIPFRTEEEALEIADATPYGLSASIWTRDLTRAHRLADRLAAGTVWVNCWLLRDLRVPFGGVKQSGVGREGGEEALRFFTEPKNVCIRT
jgi:aminomuconate-semialdehyde/2-hydroxymuconate-6-semialdehyde dehydrogenase